MATIFNKVTKRTVRTEMILKTISPDIIPEINKYYPKGIRVQKQQKRLGYIAGFHGKIDEEISRKLKNGLILGPDEKKELMKRFLFRVTQVCYSYTYTDFGSKDDINHILAVGFVATGLCISGAAPRKFLTEIMFFMSSLLELFEIPGYVSLLHSKDMKSFMEINSRIYGHICRTYKDTPAEINSPITIIDP